MSFDFSECRSVLFTGLIGAMESKIDDIRAIKRNGRGELPVSGISFDLSPWHGAVGISLRLSSDPRDTDGRFSSAEWELFDFINVTNCPILEPAEEFIKTAYKSGGDLQDMAHLVFLAGADALLDRRVAEFFLSLGVKTPIAEDKLVSHYFDYLVIDTDGSMPSNYCDIVIANRVTKRLLGNVP